MNENEYELGIGSDIALSGRVLCKQMVRGVL